MASGTQLEKSGASKSAPTPLVNRLARLGELARIRWTVMESRQRSWVAVTAVLLVGLAGMLMWYGLRTDWRTLYSGLDPDDARQIGTTLTQSQIPFDVSDGGTGIRVPASELDKARLATAAKGGAKSGRMGFEIFDKPNWVGSEFDEQVNYQRALEGELERTVGSLADVDSARVHLVLSHDSLFRDQERPAKASVMLKLRHRSLADGEPDAIRNLIASAVDGLTPDHVALMDADAHLPLSPKTAEAAQMSAEQALEEKLVATLEPVTGAGNVRASVTLDFDTTATEETQESYDPNQTVTLSMQRTEQNTGSQVVAAGVPGASSNAPNAQAVPVYPKESSSAPESAKSESSTYAASKTIKHVVEKPGRLQRLTAAIVVNDRMVQAAAGKAPARWQPRSVDELRNLTALAQAAVGFDSNRGDVLTVQDIPFDDNRAVELIPLPERLRNGVEGSPLLLKYVSFVTGILLLLAFGVRPALRQAAVSLPRAAVKPKELATNLPAAALAAVQAPELDQERIRNQAVYEQVTEHLKREPTQSSRLLQSWIHSD